MFNDDYKRIYNQILPQPSLVENTINKSVTEKPARRYNKPLIFVAIIMVLCAVLTAVPAVAMSNEAIYNAIYKISPSTAQFFVPVQESCVDNDIEISVESCYIHNNTAEIYVAMHDLRGDILDESVDLYDYTINTSADYSAGCQQVSYDEATRTATFFICIDQWDENIIGDKLTFIVKSFLTNRQFLFDYFINIDLSSANLNPDTHKQYADLYQLNSKVIDYTAFDVLDKQYNYSQGDFGDMHISAMGFIDNALHIQIEHKNYAESENSASLFLKNDLEKIEPQFYLMWYDDNQIQYEEFVFEVSEGVPFDKNLYSEYSLYGDFVISDKAYKGNWKITFPIENKYGQGNNEISKIVPTEIQSTTVEQLPEKFKADILNPKTKDDYYKKLTESCYYYNTVSGKCKSNMFNNGIAYIEYSVDTSISEHYQCYEHITDEFCFDVENYVVDSKIITIDNYNKTQSKTIIFVDDKENSLNDRYNINATGLTYASYSIEPKFIAEYLLKDFSLWDIICEEEFLGRNSTVIEGIVPESLEYGKSFKIIVDNETGIILDFESYNENGSLENYLTTTDFKTNNIQVPPFDKEKYSSYILQ